MPSKQSESAGMSDEAKSGLTRSAELPSQPTRSSDPSAVRQTSPMAVMDAQFRLLQKECARTLSLVNQLRASPLYRLASVTPR